MPNKTIGQIALSATESQVDADDVLEIEIDGVTYKIPTQELFTALARLGSTAPFAVGTSGQMVVGKEASSGDLSATAAGSFAQGYATGAGSTVVASGKGSSARGYARAGADVLSTSKGTFAGGYARGTGALISAGVTNNADGSFAFGRAYGTGSTIQVGGYGHGSAVLGEASSGGDLLVTNTASFVQGYAYTGTLTSSGAAGFAQGYAKNSGTLLSSGKASFARGFAFSAGGDISASGFGAMAGGYAHAFAITASGHGSFAHGSAQAAAIVASAENAVQFGEGTNALANSLQVGTGIRILGTVAANGSPQNGEIWREGNVVKVRSNGITVSL